MKRIQLLLLFFLYFYTVNGQSYKYAWLTDLHIGSPGADSTLTMIVNDINTKENISFTVITGDIAEKGKTGELQQAKNILDKLNKPYHIVGGNHDAKWSESGGTAFEEIFGSSRFIFNYGNDYYAGISSGIVWDAGGHASVEDIKWLKDTLRALKPEKLFLYLHHPLDGDVDNWFKVAAAVKNYNPVMVFIGHGHANKTFDFAGIPEVMSRSVLKGKGVAGYSEVEVTGDSLFVSEADLGGEGTRWFSSATQPVDFSIPDSTQFINYTSLDVITKIFNATVTAPLLAADGRIFISTYKNGIICLDYNGKELWRYNPNGTIVCKPVFYDGILVSGTAEGDLFGLEAQTGKLIQVIGLGEPVTSQLELTDVTYGNDKTKGIIIGTGKGNLYCYDLYTFEMIWENSSAAGMIESKPLIVKDKIIFGAWDGYLYCINSASGVLNWKWSDSKNFYYSPAGCSPVSDGKNVYVAAPDKNVYAIDLLLGAAAWRKPYDAWESIQLSSSKEQLYIKGMQDNFYIVSAKDGKQVKKIEIKYGTDTTPSIPLEIGEKIYFSSKNGTIYSIDKNKYTWQPELFLGTARIHSLISLGADKLAAINMDGTLAIIKL